MSNYIYCLIKAFIILFNKKYIHHIKIDFDNTGRSREKSIYGVTNSAIN